jgi:hypothetical protein
MAVYELRKSDSRFLRGIKEASNSLLARPRAVFLGGAGTECDFNHRLAVFKPSFGRALFVSPLNPLSVTAYWF